MRHTVRISCALFGVLAQIEGLGLEWSKSDKSGGVHDRVNVNRVTVDNATRIGTHDYAVGARS
jgi:hypothetical protein